MKKQKISRKRRSTFGRKLKLLLVLFFFVAGGLFYIIFHYGFDPALLAKLSFYIDLANPSVKIVRVEEGLRKEEIAQVMADKLGWDEKGKLSFINAELALNDTNAEGHYFPETYLINKDATPTEVSTMMFDEFSKQTDKILKPATKKSKQIINQDAVVTIASIIQRESNGKGDMKLISGIIWNRIFSGMKLQMDATLQYAKGNEQNGWWGQVSPEDKKIESAYNTYLHTGFPPGAIANPGIAAIDAAYNPQKTDCLFYLHDKNRQIHCAKTYEEHKKNIDKYY
ncbi:MAG: endolytic transglycosylase MltG [Patescibacteria group bacterium]|nr:endolytic transglycosylase MltG [Patescibacteria group bacterium]